MNKHEVAERIHALILRESGEDADLDVAMDCPLMQFGVASDSVMVIEFAVKLEREFAVRLSDDEIAQLGNRSIPEIADLFVSKLV